MRNRKPPESHYARSETFSLCSLSHSEIIEFILGATLDDKPCIRHVAYLLLDGNPHSKGELKEMIVRHTKPEFFARLTHKDLSTIEARTNWWFAKITRGLLESGYTKRLLANGKEVKIRGLSAGEQYDLRLTKTGMHHFSELLGKDLAALLALKAKPTPTPTKVPTIEIEEETIPEPVVATPTIMV